jgi:hypothetical protein
MKLAHLVVPDLILPAPLATELSADLALPTLATILAKSNRRPLSIYSLESWLCEMFNVPQGAVAPVTLQADGMSPEVYYWLRADPVHLNLNRSQVILQTNVQIDLSTAQHLCASFNDYFAGVQLRFFAPHPTRWYLRLQVAPDLITHSVYAVEGRDSRGFLPRGEAALQWHGVMNEIQMLLNGHPDIHAMTDRGELAPNSIWLWGGGCSIKPSQPFDYICSESELVGSFAHVAHIPFVKSFLLQQNSQHSLYVWDGLSAALRHGDYYAWREALFKLENRALKPLLNNLISGEIDCLVLDVFNDTAAQRFELTRPMLWKFWRRKQSLAHYGTV